jgi:flagellar basal-body rod modification protein FlgD
MHQVSANYTLPTVLNSLKPPANVAARNAASTRATTGTSSTTNSSSSSATSLGSTFLSLLATELENQDPTAPVDSTDMVGQMISLNQLDQLISINQAVTGSNEGTTGMLRKPAAAANDPAAGPASTSPSTTSSIASAAAAVMNQLPFDPNTLMPLNAGNFSAFGGLTNASSTPVTTSLSPASHNTSGGK